MRPTLLRDLLSAEVEVVDSSLATEPAVWVSVKGGELDSNSGSMHLSIPQAAVVRDALNRFIAESMSMQEEPPLTD